MKKSIKKARFMVEIEDGIIYFTEDNGSGAKYPVGDSKTKIMDAFSKFLDYYCE